jgi:DNA polymerase
MQISRDEVYICNTVKCRPPGNRDPLPEEKAACEPFLKLQLKILQPRVICALGTHAAQALLRSETTIGKLRLGWHEYEGIPLKPTYHPAYLLRSPGEKRKTWEDVLEVLRVYRGGNPDDSTGA